MGVQLLILPVIKSAGWLLVLAFWSDLVSDHLAKALDIQVFGFVGADLAVAGCLLGNLFSSCIFISFEEQVPLMDVISNLNMEIIIEIFKLTFSPIDLLFYGLAIYYGYKFSIVTIEQQKPVQG